MSTNKGGRSANEIVKGDGHSIPLMHPTLSPVPHILLHPVGDEDFWEGCDFQWSSHKRSHTVGDLCPD